MYELFRVNEENNNLRERVGDLEDPEMICKITSLTWEEVLECIEGKIVKGYYIELPPKFIRDLEMDADVNEFGIGAPRTLVEVAEILGKNESTVHTRFLRLMKKLKESGLLGTLLHDIKDLRAMGAAMDIESMHIHTRISCHVEMAE